MGVFELKACFVCFRASGRLEDIDCGNLRTLFDAVAGFQPDSCVMKPHYLCAECSDLVKLCYQFREKCAQANLKLKQLMMTKTLQVNTQQENKTQRLICINYDNKSLKWKMKLEPPDTPPAAACEDARSPVDEHWGDVFKEEHNDDTDTHAEDTTPQGVNSVKSELILEPDVDTQTLYCEGEDVKDPIDLLNYDLEDYPPDCDGAEEATGDWGDVIEEHIDDTIFDSGDKAPQASDENNQCANNKADQLQISDANAELQTCIFSCRVCSKTFKVKEYNHILKKIKVIIDNFVCQVCLPLVKSDWKKYKNCFEKQNYIRRRRTKTPRIVQNLKDPADFLEYSVVPEEEQYRMIQDQQLKSKHVTSKYNCPICYQSYNTLCTFTNHMKRHDPEISGNFQCDVCKEYQPSRKELMHHMDIRHKHKWTCKVEDCSFVCHNRTAAVAHYKYHKNITFSCPYCNKKFDKKSAPYFKHVRLKHPGRNIVCSLCGLGFINKRGLKVHWNKAHTKEEIKQFRNVVVDPESDWYCTHCQVQLVSENAYQEHSRSSCKETVVAPSVYRSLGEVMCHVCGKILKSEAFMKIHLLIHTGEKPFGCPLCDRKFNVPTNRDRHLITHTGEKPFTCDYCNRSFAQKCSMKCHIQTVHLKIPYEPWIRNARKRRLAKLQNAMNSAMRSGETGQ